MPAMPRLAYVRALVALSAATVAVLVPPRAQAAPPWIYRDLVLPRGNVGLDVGLGIGHEPTGPNSSITGTGLNLEVAVGVTHDFELGFRMGFRLDDAGRATGADAYGRPFDTETYGTNGDHEANPELRFRWAVARAAGAELGLELRAYLPIEQGSRFGMMFAVPVRLRAAGIVGIDTGIYVPVIFYDTTRTVVSIPVHLWFQASSRVWLGPLFGLRVVSQGGTHDEYPLGFGLGSMLNRSIDLRTWFLFPDMARNEAARSWGAGIALAFRFE